MTNICFFFNPPEGMSGELIVMTPVSASATHSEVAQYTNILFDGSLGHNQMYNLKLKLLFAMLKLTFKVDQSSVFPILASILASILTLKSFRTGLSLN